MSKPERVQFVARVAAEDAISIYERAEREGRSVGETLALILRERELYEALAQGRQAVNG